jgi:hypothetical protein
VVSSINPTDGDTGFIRPSSDQLITPAFTRGVGPAVLRAVPEGEQDLLAPDSGSPPGDAQNLLRRQVRGPALPLELPGRPDEGAVVTAVTAEPGDVDEDLA